LVNVSYWPIATFVAARSLVANLLEGVKLAEAIRVAKISTNVGRAATCASACFLAFAAGDTKNATYGAQIGVHGASDQAGRETAQAGAATVSMARIAKELGVPPAIIGRMVVTPPSEIVWLSPLELQSMGVTMLGKPQQTAPAIVDGSPIQQIPGPPTSLDPNAAQAKASTSPSSWDQVLEKAMALSASQNNGKAALTRFCQPELKTCTIALTYVQRNGKDGFMKVVQDMNGKAIARELCELNEFRDIRTCLNWDTGVSHRDMKNAKGDWFQIADE
jgi:hypothetical protein